MLVLTRRIGEFIRIGDDIVVTVQGKSVNQVRLSVTASREIPVHREEIYERIMATKKNRRRKKLKFAA